MGKYELCKHVGERITDGKGLSRLSFCVECGEPILETVFDLIACLKTPRILQDGKVKKLRWNIYKKIEFSLSYTHLLTRIVRRSGKRGRLKEEKIDVSEIDEAEGGLGWWEWAPSIMKTGEGEEGEKLPHHEPAPEKFGWGGGPGKTYRQYYQWAVEVEKKEQQMREVINEVRRKLSERGINDGFTRLLQAYMFIIYLSKLLLILPKRSMLAVCAASLINTGCSVKEAEEITGVKNLEKIYRFRKLLEKMNKLIWQDERLLKSPRVPLDKKIIGRRGKDGKMRLFKQW
jgi:hypothetical protein